MKFWTIINAWRLAQEMAWNYYYASEGSFVRYQRAVRQVAVFEAAMNRRLSVPPQRNITVVLAWPRTELWPNRNTGHVWAYRHQYAASARREGEIATLAALQGDDYRPTAPTLALTITFQRKDKHCYDLQNAFSAAKNHLDGIADALGIDDSKFEPVTLRRSTGAEACVIVQIEETRKGEME